MTAAWLRLEPAPEAAVGVVAACADAAAGCAAVLDVLAAGLRPTVLDVLDEAATAAAAGTFPLGDLGTPAPFVVLAEAEGTTAEAARGAEALREVLAQHARAVVVAGTPAETRALWRWRDGVSLAVAAQHGGKLGEDVAVPVERVADLVRETARSAPATTCPPPPGATPATGTSTRPSSSTAPTPRRCGAPGRPRTSCWRGPPPRAGRSRASTASASSSAAGSRGSGTRRRSRCTARSSGRSTPTA